jgi:hypothetical protein
MLLISWITTEAVKTQQRELILGHTLSKFMAELDMIPSGGRWGSITRLKDQMKRLFSASISCTYDDGQNWGIRSSDASVDPILRFLAKVPLKCLQLTHCRLIMR